MDLREAFDRAAEEYDHYRRNVIPCFDDFYGCLLSLVPYSPDAQIRLLDLGAGTGLVTALVLAAFPKAQATLVDISEDMLSKAKERFDGRPGIEFKMVDYARSPMEGAYDLIVSAMSIHHLEDYDKKQLFKNLFDALIPGGMFINAEIVKGVTEKTEQICQDFWMNHLKRKSGLAEDHLSQIYQRMRYDIPAPLESQMDWLREAGFTEVDCFYKYYCFAVYAGTKPFPK